MIQFNTTLSDASVLLRPIQEADADALAQGLQGEFATHTFDFFPPPYAPVGSITPDNLRTYIASRNADVSCVAFAVVDRATSAVVGSTCYLDIRLAHKGVEIGATFYILAARRTRINTACKRLLLAHAFEVAHYERVQLKCDARNTPSIRAIERIGAAREGVLRKHMIMQGGFVRDTVMFSIIREEWPALKVKLDAQLAIQ